MPVSAPGPAPGRRRFFFWLLLGCAAGILAVAAYEAFTWPAVAALQSGNPTTTAFIERYRARERAAGRSARVDWQWVPYAAISPHLKRAVVAAEDMDFFSHHGFAQGQIEAALREAWEEKELPRGASTITQQLAKNLWLSPSRNPWRKAKEALLTRALDRHLSKRRVLELYLNVVEFGPGVYGAEAAARRYFGQPASALSETAAARLAAALPKPSRWHPGSSSRFAERYAAAIERRMAKADWLRKEI